MAVPAWYEQLKWSGPVSVAVLNQQRSLPDFSGVYAFTTDAGPLLPRRVLYLGKAKNLSQRVPSYLVDWRRPKAVERHKGKGFVLEARAQRGDHGVFVQWVEYGGDISELEASLILYLRPQCNDAEPGERTPILGDEDRLDPRLLM